MHDIATSGTKPIGTGTLTFNSSFLLSSGDTSPQGIADAMALFGNSASNAWDAYDSTAVSSISPDAGMDVTLVGTQTYDQADIFA